MNEDCFHLGMKALIQRSDGKVLLLKQSKQKNNNLWDLPGGRIQRNESVLDALRREIYSKVLGKGVFDSVSSARRIAGALQPWKIFFHRTISISLNRFVGCASPL